MCVNPRRNLLCKFLGIQVDQDSRISPMYAAEKSYPFTSSSLINDVTQTNSPSILSTRMCIRLSPDPFKRFIFNDLAQPQVNLSHKEIFLSRTQGPGNPNLFQAQSPWLLFAATLLLASIKSSTASRMAKPGCRETCGNLTIPYPFGIGEGCFREGFDVSCENNTVYRHNSTSRMQINSMSLLGGQAQVNTLIASNCIYNPGLWASLNTGEFFTVSTKANKLTAVGCNTLAFLVGFNEYSAGAGCFSMCTDKQSVDDSGQCSGMGCCQTSIAPNLISSNITFDDRFNNSEVRGFNPCSYAFVARQDWFRFDPSYLEGEKFIEKFKDGVPTVLDWVAGNENCDEAVKNMSSYACISKNGHCINSLNATGYLCACNDGFEGNPYLASSFLLVMKENGLQSILDKNILEFGMELLQEVAQLAKSCLSMRGEERPLMTEVAERLKSIRVTWREQLIQNPSKETEYLLESSSDYDPSITGQQRSLMALDLETGR